MEIDHVLVAVANLAELEPRSRSRPRQDPGDPPVIGQILIRGDADRLARWLDGHELPIVVGPGNPIIAGIVLSRDDGTITLGTALS